MIAFKAFYQNKLFSYSLCNLKMVPVLEVYLKSQVNYSYFMYLMFTNINEWLFFFVSVIVMYFGYICCSPTF